MFDIVYNFINEVFFNTSMEVYGLPTILTHITMILFYICLINLVLWCFNLVKSAVGF